MDIASTPLLTKSILQQEPQVKNAPLRQKKDCAFFLNRKKLLGGFCYSNFFLFQKLIRRVNRISIGTRLLFFKFFEVFAT